MNCKNKILVFVFSYVLSVQISFSQNKEIINSAESYKGICHSSYNTVELPQHVNANEVASYLKRSNKNLNNKRVDLKLNYSRKSLAGYHFSYSQLVDGYEIYQSEIKVNTDLDYSIKSVLDNSFDVDEWPVFAAGSATDILFVKNGIPMLGKKILRDGIEIIESANDVIYERDTRSYILPDSTVTGNIFNPDPLTTALASYGGSYVDNNDATNSALNAQMQQVNFIADYSAGLYTLQNQYVKIVDFESPNITPVTSNTPTFNFNRDDDGFEDVNAFVHINRYREYVTSLGFDIASNLVAVDAHGFNGQDNSYFAPGNTPPSISFGTGGVDDAEDADVLVHEYGHFLSEMSAPGSNVGLERKSLDEGFCDYLCAAYSRNLTTFDTINVYNWDGHNEFWNGRSVSTTRVYPTNLNPSNIYRNGEMWSTALFKIASEIGRKSADSIFFESLQGYAQNMAMDDAAYLVVAADSLLFSGKYHCIIYKHMLAQGFLPFSAQNPCGISSVDNEEIPGGLIFIQHPQGFSIRNSNPVITQLNILDCTGKLVYSNLINEELFRFDGTKLSRGLYILELSNQSTSYYYKWLN